MIINGTKRKCFECGRKHTEKNPIVIFTSYKESKLEFALCRQCSDNGFGYLKLIKEIELTVKDQVVKRLNEENVELKQTIEEIKNHIKSELEIVAVGEWDHGRLHGLELLLESVKGLQ